MKIAGACGIILPVACHAERGKSTKMPATILATLYDALVPSANAFIGG
jgi:hypothetical protein